MSPTGLSAISVGIFYPFLSLPGLPTNIANASGATITAVPEPGTALLVAFGVVGALRTRFGRRKKGAVGPIV